MRLLNPYRVYWALLMLAGVFLSAGLSAIGAQNVRVAAQSGVLFLTVLGLLIENRRRSSADAKTWVKPRQ